jgi:CRISPR-associated endonuclease/helicase Cas3
VIVVDEVHAFDPDLFAAFRSFLRAFDIPCLVMTATLPPGRKHDFEELGFSMYPKDTERLERFNEIAAVKRYRVKLLPALEAAFDKAIAAFKKKKRVLWVVNTVSKCQDIAVELERRLRMEGMEPNVICYHSVFRLEDRCNRHRKTVDAFRRDAESVIGVTTQVCEMSLDLDANVLIAEEAPLSALAQRFGRSARHIHNLPKRKRIAAHVHVYPRQGENPDRPYDPADFQGVPEFLAAINGKVISQIELQEAVETYGTAVQEPDVYVAFLDSGGWAVMRERDLRDISDYRISAVLPSDFARYAALRAERKATDGLVLPSPHWATEINPPPNLPRVSVKPQYRYSQEYGLITG